MEALLEPIDLARVSIANAAQRTVLTSGQKTRVFISATINELAEERSAARAAIGSLRMEPVYFGDGARPMPPPAIYRALLRQCPIFIGIYWNEYGQLVPGLEISGIEEEFSLSKGKERLVYIKQPADMRDERLAALLTRVRDEGDVSYVRFATTDELSELIANDLARLLAERFADATAEQDAMVVPQIARPLSPLVGRTRELAELVEFLRNAKTRLVTLIGPGGVGKTRLAREVAIALEDQFVDGVAFVHLSGLSDPELVVPTIIETLGLTVPAGRSAAEILQLHFAGKQFLVLIDNFEHLLPAANQISELLQRCPGLKVMATSRSALRIHGEQEYGIEPLELPNLEVLPALDELAGVESVALFLQAARERDPAFHLDDANARAVAEICVGLDGLPLAIRLAAARLRTFPDPNVLRDHLQDRLPLLNLGDRDAPARQQTMRDAIGWSYDLLDAEAQKRFRWLSVFPGGFTEESAGVVVQRSGAQAIQLWDALDQLVDASLVDVKSGWDRNPRFRMLQTIREFGLEQLTAQGEMDAAHQAMAEYLRDHALALAERHGGNPHPDWMMELEGDIENMRSALAFARDSGDSNLLVRLVWNLWRFWNVRGYVVEGRTWLELAVAQSNILPDVVRRDVVVGAASFARRQQDFERAEELLGPVLTELRMSGDVELVVSTLLEQASIPANQFEFEEAASLLNEARELATNAGYQMGILQADAGLGTLEVNRQNFDGGRTILERVRDELRALGDHKDDATLMTCLTHIGRAAQGQGDLAIAIASTRESLALKDELGETRGRVSTLVSLARMLSLDGQIEEAETLRAEALDTALRLDAPADIAEAKLEAGRFNYSWPEETRRRLLHESLSIFRRLGERRGVTEVLEGLAHIDSMSDPTRAILAYGAVDTLRESIPFPLPAPDANRRQDHLAFLKGLVGDEAFDEPWRTGREQPLIQTLRSMGIVTD